MSVKLRAAALAAVALAGTAGVAVAHDEVEGTTPARGAVLQNLPPKVSMTFGEPVGPLDGVRVTRNGKGNFTKSSQIDPRNAVAGGRDAQAARAGRSARACGR